MPSLNPTALAVSTIKLVQDDITVGFYIEGIEDTALLIVSDLHCKVLMKQTIANRELVSITALNKGIYVARITTASGMVAKKLVKT